MKVILDTNVFISGIFFKGPPYQIVEAWNRGLLKLIVSVEILEEYTRVSEELSKRFKEINVAPFLKLIAIKATIWNVPPLIEQVCKDPDDDKFIACALLSRADYIISGDKLLLEASGYKGVRVLSPRNFVNKYIES